MNRRIFALIGIGLLTLTGCWLRDSPTPLEKAAARLTAGMDRTNVAKLFAGHGNLHGEKMEDEISGKTIMFQKGVRQGLRITYGPTKYEHAYEVCYVYFDTNGTIIGFDYLKDDGRSPGAKPRP